MTRLRAFVGHSFTADDEELVGRFLKYLNAIQKINSDFSWSHAEQPEPSAIDSKVLRLFEDKNVFIGICTRKELVLKPSALRDFPFSSTRKIIQSNDMVWKTSDWVIQEIGLACGRGLHMILLVEEGVRTPGGVQGTLEYIPFSREAPEKSFEKLLQMIASLSSGSQLTEAVDESSAPEVATEEITREKSWLSPDHTWGRDSYEIAFMHYTAMDDAANATEIERSFLGSAVCSSSEEERESWPAFAEYMRITFGKDGRVEKLADLASKHPENSVVLKYLGLAHKALGEDAKAAEILLRAASKAKAGKAKIELIAESVRALTEKNPQAALQALAEAKRIAAGSAELESLVLSIESSFSEARNEVGFRFASLERMLEERPDDHSTRFDLAYAYSEASMPDMALYHYLRIPYAERSDSTWNNLGVAYESQKLSAKSVSSYRSSIEKGGTLAASNLAHRFIGAGFIQEAAMVIESAASVSGHHKNVDSALVKLKEMPEKEGEEEKKILSAAQDVSLFYRKMGESLAASDLGTLKERWVVEGVEMQVAIGDGKFSAQGVIEESAKGLRRLHGSESPEVFDVVIVGTVRGRAIQGNYEKKRRGGAFLSNLLAGDDKEKVMLFVSANGSIELLRGSGEKKRLSVVTRIEQSESMQVAS